MYILEQIDCLNSLKLRCSDCLEIFYHLTKEDVIVCPACKRTGLIEIHNGRYVVLGGKK